MNPADAWCNCCTDELPRACENYPHVCHSTFIPASWSLGYVSLETTDTTRHLILEGVCHSCGGKLNAKLPVAAEFIGDVLLEHLYQGISQYRPFCWHKGLGLYEGAIMERSIWYEQQDKMTPLERNRQFLRLFKAKDRPAVRHWLTMFRYMPEPIEALRMSGSELFLAVLKTVHEQYGLEAAEQLIYRVTPNDRTPRTSGDTELTRGGFDFVTELATTDMDGFEIRCSLRGEFDDSGRNVLFVGSLISARQDTSDAKLIGELCGAIQYQATRFLRTHQSAFYPDAMLVKKPVAIAEAVTPAEDSERAFPF